MTTPVRTRLASERPHILIVTSDDDLRTFLAEGLLIGGFWTSSVASGLQAIELFRLRSFDLVLLDVAVQGFGGLEVSRRLRGGGGGKRSIGGEALTDVPILLIVGDGEELDPAAAAPVGVDGVLVPPIELEELIPRLFGVVEGWRTAHPGRSYADQAARARET